MPKNENFIQIQGWMLNELGLKGNDLLVYALIYGFSQDGESEFRGSITYISDWLNTSRPTTIKAINNLVERGLVLKTTTHINGITFCAYRTAPVGSKETLPPVKKLNSGSKETLPGGSKETLPNNTSINNTNDNASRAHPTVDQVREYCNERKNNVDPQRFVDYYEANGWKVGKNPMKDWKACVRNWERSEQPKQPKKSTNGFDNYQQRNIDYDALVGML